MNSSSLERNEEKEIGRKEEKEEGSQDLGIERTRLCFQEEGKVLEERE